MGIKLLIEFYLKDISVCFIVKLTQLLGRQRLLSVFFKEN